MGKPTGLDADNELQTLPAADLVVSVDEVRALPGNLPRRCAPVASRWDLLRRRHRPAARRAARVLDAAAPALCDELGASAPRRRHHGRQRPVGPNARPAPARQAQPGRGALAEIVAPRHSASVVDRLRSRPRTGAAPGSRSTSSWLHKKIFGRRAEMHENSVKIRWIERSWCRLAIRWSCGEIEVDPPHRRQHRAQLHRGVRPRPPGAGRAAQAIARATRCRQPPHRRPPPPRARAPPVDHDPTSGEADLQLPLVGRGSAAVRHRHAVARLRRR